MVSVPTVRFWEKVAGKSTTEYKSEVDVSDPK